MSFGLDLERVAVEILRSGHPPSDPRTLTSYIMDLLDYSDFTIIEQAATVYDMEHTNLVGLRGPATSGGLLLCSSLTESRAVADYLWTETEEDPYNPTIRDGLIFSHGATSGRLDLICKLHAAASVAADELRRPLIVAALIGNQARVAGAMQLLDSGLFSPQWALVGEPTNLEIVKSHRGYLSLGISLSNPEVEGVDSTGGRCFKIEVKGEPAHTAVPTMGRNAVQLAFHTISKLRKSNATFTTHDLNGGGEEHRIPDKCSFFVHTTDSSWIPAGPHLIVESMTSPVELGPPIDTAVKCWQEICAPLHALYRWSSLDESAGEYVPPNAIYCVWGVATDDNGEVRLNVDHRPMPGQRTETLIRDVEGLVRRVASKTPGMLTQVEVDQSLLPMTGSSSNELVNHACTSLREIGVPPVVGTYAGCTEGWILDASRVETIAFGPGQAIGVAHQANEYNILAHLQKAALFYKQMIRKLCC